ncbi:hypothetical protein WG901_21400 [Novosphingobium sp. PS1R-30]|uniref:DNA-binding phage zinc finger domain-containing protein n=1 Tax=Novosphingobium anseongense TaxID=3133436 RepID=A0ABU8S1W5_9SPHN
MQMTLSVPCPTCKAEVGETCYDAEHDWVATHANRLIPDAVEVHLIISTGLAYHLARTIDTTEKGTDPSLVAELHEVAIAFAHASEKVWNRSEQTQQ